MDDPNFANEQATLIRALVTALHTHAHPVLRFETHISTVLVAGEFAYKIKKPVRFDFADFSTLEARRFYCHEELRLNRRLAPELYLEVVPITGTAAAPRMGGRDAPIEFAVKMRAFPQQGLWSERIGHGLLGPAEVDQLARKLAQFHAAAERAAPGQPWGAPALLRQVADDNLALIASLARTPRESAAVARLRAWQAGQQDRLAPLFAMRQQRGFVRECHGDLHCSNILTFKDKVEVFDCIEFSDALRRIDVINELAFTCMDLEFSGCAGLAARLLDGYLEIAGDYEGLAVLRYYQVECALVRWKIALLRASQLQGEAAARHERRAAALMDYTLARAAPAAGALIVMHGFAGSGKSTVAAALVALLGAVRLRSDVERKRMAGISAGERAAAAIGEGLYDPAASAATYARLGELAAAVAEAGLPVLVDACFLQRGQRSQFEQLARRLGVPFVLVDVRASPATLRARVAERALRGDDASDAGVMVLEHQLAHHDPLSAAERARVVAVDTDGDAFSAGTLRSACAALMAATR